MRFDTPLLGGTLVRRYKRFLADVVLDDGRQVTAHTPNTGSMRGCAEPGSRVWLSDSGNPKRRYPLTWELVEAAPGVRVGVHTGRANGLVEEAIATGVLRELGGYGRIRREVRYGREGSRIDLLLEDHPRRPECHVEVKNVTLVEDGAALFPDAVSARGTKHLRELMEVVAAGGRAVLVFCVQRSDARVTRPADAIDPLYGRTLRRAVQAGVEVFAAQADPTPEEITLSRLLPLEYPLLPT